MRSLFMPLALCASLPVFAQSQSLVVCSEAAPEGFDIVQYTAATTADASAETVYERLVQFAPGSTRIIPSLSCKVPLSRSIVFCCSLSLMSAPMSLMSRYMSPAPLRLAMPWNSASAL